MVGKRKPRFSSRRALEAGAVGRQDSVSTSVRDELFDLTQDSGKYNNLATAQAKRVQKMSNNILEWCAPTAWASYSKIGAGMQEEPRSSCAPTHVSEQTRVDLRETP